MLSARQISASRFVTGLLFLLSSLICYSQHSSHELPGKWADTYDVAKELAEQEDKPILIFFTGSDWCYPCKLLAKDFFSSEKFHDKASADFVLYEADFPRQSGLVSKNRQKVNRKLQNRYDVNVYPTVVLVNHKGKRLSHISGYSSARDTQYHFNTMDRALRKMGRK